MGYVHYVSAARSLLHVVQIILWRQSSQLLCDLLEVSYKCCLCFGMVTSAQQD